MPSKYLSSSTNLINQQGTHCKLNRFRAQSVKSFTKNGHLMTHMLINREEKPHVCNDCGLASERQMLWLHSRTHAKESPYVLWTVETVTSSDKLIGHMRIHTSERRYSCTLCGQSFTQSGSLQHQMDCDKPLTCTRCDGCFSTRGDLKKDRSVDIGLDCVICCTSFNSSQLLESHMMCHLGRCFLFWNIVWPNFHMPLR